MQLVQHAAQAGEALERAELEELVEQERDRLAAAGAGAAEEIRAWRRTPRARRPRGASPSGERRRRGDRAQEPLGRRRRAFDVDLQRRSCGRARSRSCCSERRPAAAAAADAAPECATATRRAPRRCGASESSEASTCAFLTPAMRERSAKDIDLKKRRARCQFENEKFFLDSTSRAVASSRRSRSHRSRARRDCAMRVAARRMRVES